MKTDIKSMRKEALDRYFLSLGWEKYRSQQVFNWLHQKQVRSYDEMKNLPKALINQLEEATSLTCLKVVKVFKSSMDGTIKFLLALEDGHVIESVFMKYKHGNSVCISSQVGCRMGCSFCASTIGGLERQLTTAEMLEQIYVIERYVKEKVSNVVVMGTGEPLDNYESLLDFIAIISHKDGHHMSQRNLTVSTCGLVDKIYSLAEEGLGITLAISLHAPNDGLRKELMPIAHRVSIDELLNSCRYYVEKTHRRITFEYSLIKDKNDQKTHALELAKRLKGLLCHVNLIPINPIEERDYVQGSSQTVQNFKKVLVNHKINATIRRELGSDIRAACGQLRKSYYEKNQNKYQTVD